MQLQLRGQSGRFVQIRVREIESACILAGIASGETPGQERLRVQPPPPASLDCVVEQAEGFGVSLLVSEHLGEEDIEPPLPSLVSQGCCAPLALAGQLAGRVEVTTLSLRVSPGKEILERRLT